MELEEVIEKSLKDKNISSEEMFYACADLEGAYANNIYAREYLIEIMAEHAKNGDTFLAMAKGLENNPFASYFLFDESCWGAGCRPITTKEEMAEILMTGNF